MANPWKLKQDMCEIGRRMYERGLVSAFEGNLSVRLAPDRLLCTPSLLCKGLLKPEDLCVVDMSGKQLSGERKRSSEIFLHLGIYRERPEAESVVHTHAPHATAFSITHTPIPNCITGEVEVFLGEIPLAPYATPGSEQMGQAVAQLLRDANATDFAGGKSQPTVTVSGGSELFSSPQAIPQVPNSLSKSSSNARPPFAILLANHGVVSWGKSLEEALNRTEILESYCRTLILARSIGPLQRLSDSSMRELMALKQRLGLSDRRVAQHNFEDCDLRGNNVFGRGYCNAPAVRQAFQPDPAVSESTRQTGEIDARVVPGLDAMVQEIADRVMAQVTPK